MSEENGIGPDRNVLGRLTPEKPGLVEQDSEHNGQVSHAGVCESIRFTEKLDNSPAYSVQNVTLMESVTGDFLGVADDTEEATKFPDDGGDGKAVMVGKARDGEALRVAIDELSGGDVTAGSSEGRTGLSMQGTGELGSVGSGRHGGKHRTGGGGKARGRRDE